MQYVQLVTLAYVQGEAFEAAAAFSNRLADAIGDDRARRTADEFRQDAAALNQPTPTEG